MSCVSVLPCRPRQELINFLKTKLNGLSETNQNQPFSTKTCQKQNPFLYAWLNENFRKEFKQVLPCFRSRFQSDSCTAHVHPPFAGNGIGGGASTGNLSTAAGVPTQYGQGTTGTSDELNGQINTSPTHQTDHHPNSAQQPLLTIMKNSHLAHNGNDNNKLILGKGKNFKAPSSSITCSEKITECTWLDGDLNEPGYFQPTTQENEVAASVLNRTPENPLNITVEQTELSCLQSKANGLELGTKCTSSSSALPSTATTMASSHNQSAKCDVILMSSVTDNSFLLKVDNV